MGAPCPTPLRPAGRSSSTDGQGAAARTAVLVACLSLALVIRLAGIETSLTADEGYWMQRTVRYGAALARGL